jgi:sulfite reductase alpha subunit-like flavoprotein
MPRDVRKSLKEAIKAHGLKTEEEANAILLSMERKGKYVVEAWS